jgi:hypothetical protein
VRLPRWFGALNRDFRYQLTVIGTFAQAIIEREIEGGRFVIRTSEPGVKVSWQVTGIRQDAWAEKHRIRVDTAKRPKDRGRFLNPEVHGSRRSMAIGYRKPPKASQRSKDDARKVTRVPLPAPAG